jgi:hypothetical protein
MLAEVEDFDNRHGTERFPMQSADDQVKSPLSSRRPDHTAEQCRGGICIFVSYVPSSATELPSSPTRVPRLTAILFLASSVRFAFAATAQVFARPSKGPLVQTANHTSFSNHTLHDKPTQGQGL